MSRDNLSNMCFQGSKLRPFFFSFTNKISVEVRNLRLIFTSLSKQKGYQLPISCYSNKIRKEITKLFCFIKLWIFFQSKDTLFGAQFSCDITSFEHGVKYWSRCVLSIIRHFQWFLQHKYCGLIFCLKKLTRKCSAKILRLKAAKLRLSSGILSQNCDLTFSLISGPGFRDVGTNYNNYPPIFN